MRPWIMTAARTAAIMYPLALGCSTYDECNPSLWEADQFFAVHGNM